MSVKITQGEAVLFDSVTGQAFGPVWPDYDDAEEFLKWALDSELPSVDELTYKDLAAAVAQFYADRAASGSDAPSEDFAEAWREHNDRLQAMCDAAGEREKTDASLAGYARRGVASMTTGETASQAYDRAIESYVQDNGDWVPITVAEWIREEVARLLAEGA